MLPSGRYDFGDGGYYCGEYYEGVVQGHGICVSPSGQGQYSGRWHRGIETSGVYTWSNGKIYEGCWSDKKKHGLGVETKDKWIYQGEWTRGLIGRYGCKYSRTSKACYEGTWSAGLMDGYGVESSADGGVYQGQWFQGMRHGHGVRVSVPYELAACYRPASAHPQKSSSTFHSFHNFNVKNTSLESSLPSLHSDADDVGFAARDRRLETERGGFVLQGSGVRHSPDSINAGEDASAGKSGGGFQTNASASFKRNLIKTLKFNKYGRQQKTDASGSRSLPQSASGSPVRRSSGSVRSLASADSNKSAMTDRTGSQASFVSQNDVLDGSVVETYSGEWKSDKRCGHGIACRSDGLKYEGEWFNNKKNGYGVTTFLDESVEEGKYKNNVLVTVLAGRKTSIFAIRTARLRDQVDTAVSEARKASQIATEKTKVAIDRMTTARTKAKQAREVAEVAKKDSSTAKQIASKSWHAVIEDADINESIQLRRSLTEEKDSGISENQSQNSKESSGTSLIRQVLGASFRRSFRRTQAQRKNVDKSQPGGELPGFDIRESEERPTYQSVNAAPATAFTNNTLTNVVDNRVVTAAYVPPTVTMTTPDGSHFQKVTQRNVKQAETAASRESNRPFSPNPSTQHSGNAPAPSTSTATHSANLDFPAMNYFEKSRLKRNKDPIDVLIGGVPKTKAEPVAVPASRVGNYSMLSRNLPSKSDSKSTASPQSTSSKLKENLSWFLLMLFNVSIAVAILTFLHRFLT